MPRHPASDPEVRKLIDRLARLHVAYGSVGALQRALTDVLAADRSEGWIYPNRLHAILSEDPSRAINTETLRTLQLAIARIIGVDDDPELAGRVSELRARAIYARERHVHAKVNDRQALLQRVADEVDRPLAVTRWLLGGMPDDGPIPSAPKPTPQRRSKPDWRFQDHAYEACLYELRKDPDRKVGLVLPTGAGKTRVAMRVMLRVLANSDRDDTVAVWLTHREWLQMHAQRELQRALNSGTPDLPPEAMKLLSHRVRFTKPHGLRQCLEEVRDKAILVVVDEAHHAAAPSYKPIFEHRPMRGLFLTATPNRTDAREIGIDEIAYTITYRELFELGVLIEPSIEPPLTVEGLDWDVDANLRDLADYLLNRAQNEFVKTLVVTSRREHSERMYSVLVEELHRREDCGEEHVLDGEDLGFVHGESSSTGDRPQDFLDKFTSRPRGVLVTTNSLLGEGFDDPLLNAVVVTFPTESIIQLMQSAGRALRHAPDKERAYIVQVRDSDLAYHYEQRWLYQDISDRLRPQLDDMRYTTHDDLQRQVETVVRRYNLSPVVEAQVLEAANNVAVGEKFSILLTGLPYYGPPDRFKQDGQWGAVQVSTANRSDFLRVFNDFSERGASVNQPSDFLRNYMATDPTPGSSWIRFMDMMHAMDYARQELDGTQYHGAETRGYVPNKGTTWLRYVTFAHRAATPEEFEQFLSDALNREAIAAAYSETPANWAIALKVDHPLGGTWAWLLNDAQAEWFEAKRVEVRARVEGVRPEAAFGALAQWRLEQNHIPVAQALFKHFDSFISESAFEQHAYRIPRVGRTVATTSSVARSSPSVKVMVDYEQPN